MSDFYPPTFSSHPTCKCGEHELLSYVKGCVATQRGNLNLMDEAYLVPPSSPDLTAVSDSTEEDCEQFRREEIESEREFNEGRAANSQLMDATVKDIANVNERAMPAKDAPVGDASYAASERNDDSCTEPNQLLVDHVTILRQVLADKNGLVESLTSQLQKCQSDISGLQDQAETSAEGPTIAKDIAALNMGTAIKARDEINECRDSIRTRDEDVASLWQTVSSKDSIIKCLKAEIASKSDAYSKLEKGCFAEIDLCARRNDEVIAKLVQEHNGTISDKEALMRQLADKLVCTEKSGKRNIDLLDSEICEIRVEADEKQRLIDQHRRDIDELHTKVGARNDTIIQQHKQIKAHLEEFARRNEQVEKVDREHEGEVESLQEKIARKNVKIDSLRTENRHLARALACERGIVNDQIQEIAEIQESSMLVAEELQRVRLQREHEDKDCVEKIEFLQSIIGSKNEEVEQALLGRERDENELHRRLDVLQNIVASKNAELEKIRLEREADEKNVISKLKFLHSDVRSKDQELSTLQLKRDAEAKKAFEKLGLVINVKNEALQHYHRERESDQIEAARKVSLLQKVISDKTGELSTTRYSLTTTTAQKASLITDKSRLYDQLTQVRKDAAANAKIVATRYNDHVRDSGVIISRLKDKVAHSESALAENERTISALRADNATLELTLEERNQVFESYMRSARLVVEDRAQMVLRISDLEADAAGWDRVASEETFEPEVSLEDVVTVDAEERVEVNDEKIESVGSVEEGEAQKEELPTYEEATSQDTTDVIVEAGIIGGNILELEGEDGDDEADLFEEEDDWTDMSSQWDGR